VRALGVRAHVVESHVVLSPPGLALKEDGLLMTALRTGMLSSSRKCWVVNHITHYTRQFIDFVCDFVDINAVIVCDLFVITVSTGVEQHSGLLVFARIQHVVAFLTELNAHKLRSFRFGLYFLCQSRHRLCQSIKIR